MFECIFILQGSHCQVDGTLMGMVIWLGTTLVVVVVVINSYTLCEAHSCIGSARPAAAWCNHSGGSQGTGHYRTV